MQSIPTSKPITDLAHEIWKELIASDDIVIDATCGNGRDTLFLANETPCKLLYALDIQAEALASTQNRLDRYLSSERKLDVKLYQQCHTSFPEEIESETVACIVYNLGYLPGGNKSKTTRVESTLKSITAAQKLLKKGGSISIACYPGHPEGALEEKALLDFARSLESKYWKCSYFFAPERKSPPSLLFLEKIK